MGIIKKFIYDGINSKDYGLGVSGRSAYNGAKRSVEMITIPGRDGEFVLDHNRFENIPITYQVGAFSNNQPDFAQKIAALRNELLSRSGYKRLEDDYNINEYRMGVYESGLELDPVAYSTASEFEIVFNCKPQRFLKSGEERITVQSGAQIINPTPYKARPLLEVTGYGDLEVNGDTINLNNSVDLGQVIVAPEARNSGALNLELPLRPILASGDSFDVSVDLSYHIIGRLPGVITSLAAGTGTVEDVELSETSNEASFRVPITSSFVWGTAKTFSAHAIIDITSDYSGTVSYYSYPINYSIQYSPSSNSLIISSTTSWSEVYYYIDATSKRMSEITAYSSASALGDPTYVDLDIGEAYRIIDDEVVSVNGAVSIGAELPALDPGENIVSFGNTITDVKIMPRWWII